MKRRRRTPDEARAEILAAAMALLTELPSHEVTVSAIMSRTTLSRKSFYGYFRDRAQVFDELLAPLRAETDAAVDAWRRSTDMVGSGRAALRFAARLYRRHGVVLRALAAASGTDEEAARVWRSVIEPVVVVAAEKIAEATGRPGNPALAPLPTARALMTMNVHYLLATLDTDDVDTDTDTETADIDVAVETLMAIWERTILLRHPDDRDAQP